MAETEENPPLIVDGHLQGKNLPLWGKWIGGAVASFLMLVWPAIQHVRTTHIQEDATRAKQKADEAEGKVASDKHQVDLGWKELIPRLTTLETWKHDVEVRDARAEAARRRRRPSAIVVPPAPKPLPLTLKAVEEQAKKTGAAAPAAPLPKDAGP